MTNVQIAIQFVYQYKSVEPIKKKNLNLYSLVGADSLQRSNGWRGFLKTLLGLAT